MNDERDDRDERDTQPPTAIEPGDEPAVMTERRFREVLAEVIGTRFVELHERVTNVERRMTDIESAVRALAIAVATSIGSR